MGVGVERGEGKGKGGNPKYPDREGLSGRVSSRKKEEGQGPASPDQPQHYTSACESKAGRQTGKRIAAPSNFFPRLDGGRQDGRNHDDVPRFIAEERP